MFPTWQLIPSKLYHRLCLCLCLLLAFELLSYWHYGYVWQVTVLFLVWFFLSLKAYQSSVVSIQCLGGQWMLETQNQQTVYAKSIRVCWLSKPAMVLLLNLHQFPYRKIVLLFSDQFQADDEHSFRWHLLVKNASYRV
jgi:hypothetical protein